MRASLVFLIAAAILAIGGYAGLVWLDPTTTREVPLQPQLAAATSNENMPSESADNEQDHAKPAALGQNVALREASGPKTHSLRTRGDEGLDQSDPNVVPSSATQQAGSDGSKTTAPASDQAARETPSGACMPIGVTAAGALVFPMQCIELLAQHGGASLEGPPQVESAVATDQVNHPLKTISSVGDQQIVNVPSTRSDADPIPVARAKSARPGGAQQSLLPRNDQRSHQRFARLLNDPLALNCMTCVLFGR